MGYNLRSYTRQFFTKLVKPRPPATHHWNKYTIHANSDK